MLCNLQETQTKLHNYYPYSASSPVCHLQWQIPKYILSEHFKTCREHRLNTTNMCTGMGLNRLLYFILNGIPLLKMLLYRIRRDIDHVCLSVKYAFRGVGVVGVGRGERMERKNSIRYGNLQSSVGQIKDCNHALLAFQT